MGGAAGAHIRKGDLLCVMEGEDAAMRISGRFMQYYRENAKWKERTYTFVPRIGLEKIRAIVVDDAEGVAATLDANMQASIDGAYDPWKEALKPKTANQFASLIAAEA